MNDGIVQVEAVCPGVVRDIVEMVLEVSPLLDEFFRDLAVLGGGDGYQVGAGHGEVGFEVKVDLYRYAGHREVGESSCKLGQATLYGWSVLVMGVIIPKCRDLKEVSR